MVLSFLGCSVAYIRERMSILRCSSQIKDLQKQWRATGFVVSAIVVTSGKAKAMEFGQSIKSLNKRKPDSPVVSNAQIKEYLGGVNQAEATAFCNWIIDTAPYTEDVTKAQVIQQMKERKMRTNASAVVMNPNIAELVDASQSM
jgi:hypothetical protein